MGLVKIFAVVPFLFFLQDNCSNINHNQNQQEGTKIRVMNKSGLRFTHVSLFSMPFKDLQPGDSSEYKTLDYNPLKDDPLIYCVANGKNVGRYLEIPKDGITRLTYVIDSLKNDIIYVNVQIDN